MADVFISYNRKQRDRVLLIKDKLEALKVAVWFDARLEAGESFGEEIKREITAARAVLVCWTPQGIDSQWVKGEATLAKDLSKLVPCMLEPTQLEPPFNVLHTEDLTNWEGEDSYAAWLKLLERIGELIERPGLAAYSQAIGEGGQLAAMRAWANGHGADPLAAEAWARIQLLEGESSAQRIARERKEAKDRDERRRGARRMAARVRQGAKGAGRGLTALLATAGLVLVLGGGGYGAYTLYQNQQQAKAGAAAFAAALTPDSLRAALAQYGKLAEAEAAREQLAALDAAAWEKAQTERTLAAYEAYLNLFPNGASPPGRFTPEALAARRQAKIVLDAQDGLTRLAFYQGVVDGRMNGPTRDAISRFQQSRTLPVNGAADELLLEDIATAQAEATRPTLDLSVLDAGAQTPTIVAEAEPPTDAGAGAAPMEAPPPPPAPPPPSGGPSSDAASPSAPTRGAVVAPTRPNIDLPSVRDQAGRTRSADASPQLQTRQAAIVRVPALPPSALRAETTAPLTDVDIRAVAGRMGVEPAALAALVASVSAPRAFEEDGRPYALFEPTAFTRATGGRFTASHPTLSPAAGARFVRPRSAADRWAQLEAAVALDQEAAYRATTWGRFQILGANHQAAGYPTATAFMADTVKSEAKQLEALGRYIGSKPGLLAALRGKDWARVVREYQGPNPRNAAQTAQIEAAYAAARARLGG